MAMFPILTADGDTIVTADGFAVVVEGTVIPPVFNVGNLIVPPDNSLSIGDPGAVFSPIDGSIIATPTLALAEVGAMLESGIMCLLNEAGTGYNLFAADYSLIGTPAPAGWAGSDFSPVTAFNPSTFYVSEAHATLHTTRVTTISDAGVVGGTIWTLPASVRVVNMAVSLDATTLYYCLGNTPGTMKRYDLIGNAPLSDLFSLTGAERFTFDMYVLTDGSLLVCVFDNNTREGTTRQYSAAGTLLHTYDIGVTPANGSTPFMAIDVGGAGFWVRTFPDAPALDNDYYHYRLSDQSLLHTFTALNTSGGGQIPFSCPLFVTGAGSTSTTYPIRRLRRWAP